jgi:hypothetical protein
VNETLKLLFDHDMSVSSEDESVPPPTVQEYQQYRKIIEKRPIKHAKPAVVTSLEQIRELLYSITSLHLPPLPAKLLVHNVMQEVELVWSRMPKRQQRLAWKDVINLYSLVDHRYASSGCQLTISLALLVRQDLCGHLGQEL